MRLASPRFARRSNVAMCYKVGLIAAGFVISHVNRGLESNISESTHVNNAMFNCIILMLVYSALYYTVQVPSVLAALRALSVSLAILTSALTIFRPKMARIYKEQGGVDRSKGVYVGTAHQSKGLEWKVVFVVGMHDGESFFCVFVVFLPYV